MPTGFQTFSAALSFGEETVLLETGSLQLIAQCNNVVDSGFQEVDLVIRSSIDGWYTSSPSNTARDAGEASVASRAAPAGQAAYGQSFDRGHATAPDGSYIGYPLEMAALGVNVFGHDCVVMGMGAAFQADW